MKDIIKKLKVGDAVPVPPEPKTEAEIMENWKGDLSQPLVSIVCHTYNHVNYIKDALNGFLMQETDFPFEIIVHDDASTDGTQEIIAEYVQSYSGIIRVIQQVSNQFSQGIKPSFVTFPKAKGKYISFCEGDDFWCCPNKLSHQYYAMKNRPKASICFHPSMEINEQNGDIKVICKYKDNASAISSDEVIIGRGGSVPSSSLFFKNDNVAELLESFRFAPIGDFFIQSYMALVGEVYFLPDVMSAYRRNSLGSWTNSQSQKEKRKQYYAGMISSIDSFYGKFKNKKTASVLIKPLCFYYVCYLLIDKKPLSVLNRFFEQLLMLKNFNRFLVFLSILSSFSSRLLSKLCKV